MQLGNVERRPLISLQGVDSTNNTAEYGMKIYFNCSDSTLKQVETIQHECLRICVGDLRCTPIDCLQHYWNEMPLKIKFYQLCLYYRAHFSIFTDHPTSAVIIDSWPER